MGTPKMAYFHVLLLDNFQVTDRSGSKYEMVYQHIGIQAAGGLDERNGGGAAPSRSFVSLFLDTRESFQRDRLVIPFLWIKSETGSVT